MKRIVLLIIASALLPINTWATKLYNISIADREIILVTFRDGEITFRDDATGWSAYLNDNDDTQNSLVTFGNPLNTAAAKLASNWTICSDDDATYGATGLSPVNCYRKSKISGMGQFEWVTAKNDYRYEMPFDHFIYLVLPQALKDNCKYTIKISSETETDKTSVELTFDIFNSRSEAIHTNIVGFMPTNDLNFADIYLWMGDGGHRNYNGFTGNKIYLYNIDTEEKKVAGTVGFWMDSGTDVGYYDFFKSPVWKADFSANVPAGNYRLVVEGIGCSDDFQIQKDIYKNPYDVSVKGYYYMRIGEDCMECVPVPRRPLYIPGKSPENTVVYITTMQPYHADWTKFSRGDYWDNPNDWAAYKKEGSPVNTKAIGGHSDAFDWDRHLGHISNIYDMLLPYYITHGTISDDNCGIKESGNGIPDILDEARNEVDFWLNLRDGTGYSHGLTNPNSRSELFQAGNTTVAAWANAANSAMLAECFRIAGKDDLMKIYLDSAKVAFQYALSQSDMMLYKGQDVGEGYVRGKDLRMTAAAYLYNLTGDVTYENYFAQDCDITSATSVIAEPGNKNQLWAIAAYLFTDRTVNYPQLLANIKRSVIYQARQKEAGYIEKRPSRRASHADLGYYHTEQNVHHTILAHAITDDSSEKAFFLKALIAEADWGLGRNPLNMIQMTTAATKLENERSVMNAYTAGRNDGTPGVHPGHTPYMNVDDWGGSMFMGLPSSLYKNSYPAPATPTGSSSWGNEIKKVWPEGELFFETRYVYAHSEFTPQQTMRGKMALYGYLHALGKEAGDNAIEYVELNDIKPPEVFPNPAKNVINIRSFNESLRLLELFDVRGQLLKKQTAADYFASVNISDCPFNVYFLKITTERNEYTKKVIIRN
ncbi:MAG: T9SS type A sorting domain-containing protein [Tannerella sp.]|jgi:hypothetical protein|nr:T9SS type A sorting domain-containing protein [Tannerella sp.]